MKTFSRYGFKMIIFRLGLLFFLAFSILQNYPDAETVDRLEAGFKDPPHSAQPRVWWHWTNGNITKEGIKADLEWMNRIGIGGFQNFDAALAACSLRKGRGERQGERPLFMGLKDYAG